MRKPYMCTIIDSSGSDCILIILFQICDPKAGLFEGNLLWVAQYYPSTFILEEELNQY